MDFGSNDRNEIESLIMKRCEWAGNDPLYVGYHDTEWGVPLYDDCKLFEFLVLEGMQAGLNWLMVLKKRENFRAAFDNFDPQIVATYDEKKIGTLLKDQGIIRNKLKIKAALTKPKVFLDVKKKNENLRTTSGNSPILNPSSIIGNQRKRSRQKHRSHSKSARI